MKIWIESFFLVWYILLIEETFGSQNADLYQNFHGHPLKNRLRYPRYYKDALKKSNEHVLGRKKRRSIENKLPTSTSKFVSMLSGKTLSSASIPNPNLDFWTYPSLPIYSSILGNIISSDMSTVSATSIESDGFIPGARKVVRSPDFSTFSEPIFCPPYLCPCIKPQSVAPPSWIPFQCPGPNPCLISLPVLNQAPEDEEEEMETDYKEGRSKKVVRCQWPLLWAGSIKTKDADLTSCPPPCPELCPTPCPEPCPTLGLSSGSAPGFPSDSPPSLPACSPSCCSQGLPSSAEPGSAPGSQPCPQTCSQPCVPSPKPSYPASCPCFFEPSDKKIDKSQYLEQPYSLFSSYDWSNPYLASIYLSPNSYNAPSPKSNKKMRYVRNWPDPNSYFVSWTPSQPDNFILYNPMPSPIQLPPMPFLYDATQCPTSKPPDSLPLFANPQFECSSEGVYPLPNSVDEFVICHRQDGVMNTLKMKCPLGTAFDSDSRKCSCRAMERLESRDVKFNNKADEH